MQKQPLREALFEEPRLQSFTRRGREPQAELLDRLRRDVAPGELGPRPRAGRRRELLAEVRRRDLVDLQQRLAQRGIPAGIVATALAWLGQGHADLLREHPHGVLKTDLLVQLEELEHVAAGAASEAVEEPLFRMHLKRRRLLGVERAEPLVRRPRALQRDVLLHNLQDVRLQAEVVDELLGEQTHTRLVSW